MLLQLIKRRKMKKKRSVSVSFYEEVSSNKDNHSNEADASLPINIRDEIDEA